MQGLEIAILKVQMETCLLKMWISEPFPRHSNLESEAGTRNLHFDRHPWGF